MKIVIICEHFSKGMGYIENKLPEALAGLGMEVHLITTKRRANAMVPGLEPKWATDSPDAALYSPPIQENGVLIHCLPWRTLLWRPRILMLRDKIRQISPSIVQIGRAHV